MMSGLYDEMAKEARKQPINRCIQAADWRDHYHSGDSGEDSEERIIAWINIVAITYFMETSLFPNVSPRQD